MIANVGLIVAGLVLLVVGGEGLVRGASALARRIGMSALVVGLTVVSVATSAPELAVTTGAVLGGETDLAVGNVVGSNTANVLLILGVGGLLAPLVVKRAIILRDLPVMLALSLVLLIMAMSGTITRTNGIVLLALFVAVTAFTVWMGRTDEPEPQVEAEPPAPVWRAGLFILVGVAALVGGAQLLVTGAVGIATSLGVSKLVIGLTVVSIGTSLPELAATVVAVRRGEVDMAVGNVVGSNIANIGLVLGLPATLASGGIAVPPSSVALDIPLMIAATVALLVMCYTGREIARWEGLIMLGLYLAYVAYMVIASTDHDSLRGFTLVMVWFVLPVIGLLLFATFARQFRKDARVIAADSARD